MTSIIVFDSDDIVVHFNEGRSDYVLVTFMGIGHEANATASYFGKPIVERENISCIGITNKVRNWYTSQNMHTALRLICSLIKERYRSVITIGLSAGAYAAIKYSRILGARRTLALGPQLTIDDREGNVLPEWAALCTPSMRGMGIKPQDLHGTIFTLFDRRHVDDHATVQHLLDYVDQGAQAEIVPINVPSAGHIVYESLKGSANLVALIAMLNEQDATMSCARNLRIATSRFRRSNTTNLYNKIQSGYRKFPKLVYDILSSERFCRDFRYDDILRDETLLFRVCAALNEKGYVPQSRALLRGLIDYYASGEFSPGGDDHVIVGMPVMLDHRGRTLGYSSRERRFTSSNIVWMEGDAIPVSLTHINRVAYPSISLFGRRFFLDLDGHDIRASVSPGRIHAQCRGTTCGIRNHEERYLTVVGDREMVWSAHQLSYETFSVVTV
ncbi:MULTISPECIES: hypothetical protein [Asaia]|uniref:hypothetical protein n=1 Tax=Asaia TaxID=91914 RepID=UPI002554A2E2|nr:hypothetical protein [Asaia sp. HumB]MDL2170305.1 hypothetical protein [Asaia sp. HumB]